MSSRQKPLPPRWLNCPRKGNLIADVFIPFKTPLNGDYDEQVPEEHRFPPSMLIAALNSRKLKMGLWIDLTNTSRFYNKTEVKDMGIRYLKLACKGRDECPTVEQTDEFIRECKKFIVHHPLEKIGVHCTHGFNRTGFLIIAYLIQIHDYSIDAAVQEFKKMREPGIYKSDYLRELAARYGDPNDVPPTPPKPDWCNEYDDSGVDDDGISLKEKDNSNDNDNSNHIGNSPKKRRREFMKKNPIFMDGITGVTVVTESRKLTEIQSLCQDMCGWESTGFPGSQPVSMDVKNIRFLTQKPYKVSWKADGTRYMMVINGNNEVYFVDRDNAVYKVSGIQFPKRKNLDQHLTMTLLDGEMIIDKVDGQDHPKYLIYDIIRFEIVEKLGADFSLLINPEQEVAALKNQEVGKTDFERRLYCIGHEIINVRKQAMQEGRIDKSREPFSIRKKDFWDIPCTKSLFGAKFTSSVGHEIDGLVFQPVPDPYMCGQSPAVLKWKPPHLNSVDFKLVITVEEKLGMLRESVGNLYVGGMDVPFGRIKVTKDLKAYDKKIIECKYEEGQWKFMRERTDKSFPNSHKTACAVCQSIKEPVTEDGLLCYIDQHGWRPNRRP